MVLVFPNLTMSPIVTRLTPFNAREFSKLNTDEKEALFIWLHKDDMPQA